MKGKNCLGIEHTDIGVRKAEADYYPKNFKEAKKQLIKECIGKTGTNELLGLCFRMTLWDPKEIDKFDKFASKVCDNFVKKHNGMKREN